MQPSSVSKSGHYQLLRGRQRKCSGLMASLQPHSCRLFQRFPVEASDLKNASNLLENICYSQHFADPKGTETIITQMPFPRGSLVKKLDVNQQINGLPLRPFKRLSHICDFHLPAISAATPRDPHRSWLSGAGHALPELLSRKTLVLEVCYSAHGCAAPWLRAAVRRVVLPTRHTVVLPRGSCPHVSAAGTDTGICGVLEPCLQPRSFCPAAISWAARQCTC